MKKYLILALFLFSCERPEFLFTDGEGAKFADYEEDISDKTKESSLIELKKKIFGLHQVHIIMRRFFAQKLILN